MGTTLEIRNLHAQVEETEMPTPSNEGEMENAWAVHQMKTTMNFCPDNLVLNWFVGGLNYQVEHHLFPNICHVHYKKLSKIVKETAAEFNVPYNSHDTFFQALFNHGKMLKDLGKA